MGIIPMTIMYLLVTAANIINTYYLVDANDGIKRSKLPLKSDMKIENDYANLMYQVSIMYSIHSSCLECGATTFSWSFYS